MTTRHWHYVAFLLLAGCTSAQMVVPPQLAKAESIPVTDRPGLFSGDTLRFGAYVTSDVHRGLSGSETLQINEYFNSESGSEFGFSMLNTAVACRGNLKTEGVKLGDLTLTSGKLGLACKVGDGWFVMQETSGRHQHGRITVGKVVLEVDSEHRITGADWDVVSPIGFKMSANGRFVGAVQTVNGGNVWLASDADAETRRAVAIVAAVALTAPELRDH